MSEAVPGTITLTIFMLLTGFSFFFLINLWVEQDALQNEAAAFLEARLESGLSVQSISASSADCGVFTGPYVAGVANTGDLLYTDFSKMDALIDYRDSGSAPVAKRLTYGVDWSVASITPDNLDPNSWNPNETALVNFTVSPALDLQTRGRLVLMTPQGVFDSAYFTCIPTEYYLNNNPTPPTGNTNAQAILPMNPGLPTQTTLFNYDQDRDALAAGLLILAGGGGADESDSTEHQVWRSGALLDDLHLSSVDINFWSAVEDFTLGTTGSATFYLRDFDGSSHTEIGDDVVFDGDWQGGSGTFVQHTASIAALDYTIAEGDQLEVKLMVDSSAVNDMWFAYDTSDYPSVVQITP
ncbi:MAG TPA: hypothetical protein VFR55_07215 [Dehalococcoidia bacterium]|nr:hypothetical protein [Dehalococcoidia bacterium]